MITYMVRFENADQADRVAARLRNRGIALQQYQSNPATHVLEPGLIVGIPYGYPASTASPNYTTGLINGLPQTDGNTLIYPMPFFERKKQRSVDVMFTVSDFDAERARKILINSGGKRVQIIQ